VEKFEYFIDQTNKRFDKIDEKLDELISFRIMLIGAATAISAIVSVALTVFLK
jgi:hypothetical protein